MRSSSPCTHPASTWRNALPCPIAFRATDEASKLDAVATGLGVGVLPCVLAERCQGLVCLESIGPPEPEVIWLVTHPDARRTERVRVVTEWLLELFAAQVERLAGRSG